MTIFELDIFWIHIAPSYYGLMYAVSFFIWYFILYKRNVFEKKDLENLFLYVFLWVLLWWRLGYVLFYNLSYYLSNPFDVLKVWEWWMSFHGGALWVIISLIIFSKIYNKNFFKIVDEITLLVPIWLFFWRIWNYLNKELLGFPYEWFLAVEKAWNYYFPSPLLEAFLEWIILFLILIFVYKKRTYYGQIWASFLIWYWVFRTIVELFFREPDSQIWYIFSFFTLWSLLSIPMIIIWLFLSYFLRKKYEINTK